MILHLLRHAEAENTKPGRTDAERELTAHGRTEAQKLAQKQAKKLADLTCILTSPLPRARDTAHIFANILSKRDLVKEIPWLASGADPLRILKYLKDYERETEMMLVGHEPWISELSSLIIAGHTQSLIKIKKLGMATFRIHSLSAQGGVLLRLR